MGVVVGPSMDTVSLVVVRNPMYKANMYEAKLHLFRCS